MRRGANGFGVGERSFVERCAGLDVHQATVVACLSIGAGNAKPSKQIRTVGTMDGSTPAQPRIQPFKTSAQEYYCRTAKRSTLR